MRVVKACGDYAIITEVAKKRKSQFRILVRRLDSEIYRFLSDEIFSEPASFLLLTWLTVSRLLTDTVGQSSGNLVFLGVPPCFHKSVMENLRIGIQEEESKGLLGELCRDIHFQDGIEEGCSFMCYDPIEDPSVDGLVKFLQASDRYLLPQGMGAS